MTITVRRTAAIHRMAGGSIAPRLDGVSTRHSAGIAARVTASVTATNGLYSG